MDVEIVTFFSLLVHSLNGIAGWVSRNGYVPGQTSTEQKLDTGVAAPSGFAGPPHLHKGGNGHRDARQGKAAPQKRSRRKGAVGQDAKTPIADILDFGRSAWRALHGEAASGKLLRPNFALEAIPRRTAFLTRRRSSHQQTI